jgi:hypothetical protein
MHEDDEETNVNPETGSEAKNGCSKIWVDEFLEKIDQLDEILNVREVFLELKEKNHYQFKVMLNRLRKWTNEEGLTSPIVKPKRNKSKDDKSFVDTMNAIEALENDSFATIKLAITSPGDKKKSPEKKRKAMRSEIRTSNDLFDSDEGEDDNYSVNDLALMITGVIHEEVKPFLDDAFGKIPTGQRVSTLTGGAKNHRDDLFKLAFDKINEIAPTLQNLHATHCSGLANIHPRFYSLIIFI